MKWLELKIPPLLVAVIFGVLIWAMPRPYEISNSMVLYVFSGIFFFIGSMVSVLGVWEFKKKKTTVNPMFPKESNSLVVSGVYKYTRNPMYLGFLSWLLALGVLLGKPASIIPIVLFVFYMNSFQITPEEKVLSKLFGPSYLDYCNTVRRWL